MPRVELLLALVLGATACRDQPPPGVEDVRIESPARFHVDGGFVHMVPPIHIPSSRADADMTEIWLRVPAGGVIEAVDGPDGRPSLDFPPGTVADRVEWRGVGSKRRIVDIRGATIDDDRSQRFHVYRPTEESPTAPLFGLRWGRRDAAANKAATDRLIAKLATFPPATELPEQKRQNFLKSIGGKNRCMPCHEPDRPDNTTAGEHGLVNRGTDHSGFFTPTTVLRDVIPLEGYGGNDRSLDDPAITVSCGGGELQGRTCDNEQVPLGKWSFVRAQEADPARAEQVCAARRYLAERMSPAAQSRFADSLADCNL